MRKTRQKNPNQFSLLPIVFVFLVTLTFSALSKANLAHGSGSGLESIDGKNSKRPQLNSDPVCRSGFLLITAILSLWYGFHNHKYFSSVMQDPGFAKAVLENFVNRLDPHRVFLFQSEYEQLYQVLPYLSANFAKWPDQLIPSVMMPSKTAPALLEEHCRLMDQVFGQLWEALDRHVLLMRQVYTVENLKKLKHAVFAIEGGLALQPFELLFLLQGPGLSVNYVSNQFELIGKVNQRFFLEYMLLRNLGEPDREAAWVTAHRRIKRLRADYDFMELNNVIIAWADSIINAADSYGRVMTGRQYKRGELLMSSGFFGLGARFVETEKGRRVVFIEPGGPAERQGILKVGDIVVGLSGNQNVSQMDDEEFWFATLGSDATPILLEVFREGRSFSYWADRGSLSTPSLFANNLEDSVEIQRMGNSQYGYVRLPSFYGPGGGREGLARQLFKVLLYFDEKAVDGIIVDLRGNQGGLQFEEFEALDLFLGGGPLRYWELPGSLSRPTVFDDRNQFTHRGEIFQFRKPVLIWIDANSASSAEGFAGTMQDYRRALVVGERSFGKGSMQMS
ncbi:MAG: S41 family peptidase, partial [Bdellovibrionaceae bacterium]|nr:S41 family peptidase [Pseudobdellovibrionaceae bacterium]MDW8191038.1 S41 family peptidase [Pseudobdellovibrionaceae bacterium]